MRILGGAYTTPITFFSNSYTNGNFRDPAFWDKERASWGRIVHRFQHKSISIVTMDDQKRTLETESEVLITTDGLIVSEIPSWAETNEQAHIALHSHLSSFLAILNMGGRFFSPLSEKEIEHVSLKDNALAQRSAGGDNSLDRALLRYRTPFHVGTPLIDFNWVGLIILSSEEVEKYFALGTQITDGLKIKSNQLTLSLEAYGDYTLQKWNNTLLLGWTFLEILIGRLWNIEFVDKAEDGKRRKRLNRIRKLRNELIHDGRSSHENEVSDFFDLTVALVKILTKIEPQFLSPGWSRSGWPGLR